MTRRVGVLLLVAGCFLLANASLAVSAPKGSGGSGGGGSAIWIASSSSRSADGTLHLGDSLSFGFRTTSTASDGSGPWLKLQCTQDGVLVFSDVRAGFEGGYGYGEAFQAGPSMRWVSGDAACTGILGSQGRRSFQVEATTRFSVVG